MRFSRLVLLSIVVGVAAACENDKVTTPSTPPHSDMRFINAVSDTGAVDIRFVDQIDLSPFANALAFRAASLTGYQPVEAKSRHLRVFPTSLNIAITSQVLLDTTITIPDGQRFTLMLTGPSRTAGQLKFVMITDDITAPPAGQIAVRTVNASTGAVAGYLLNATTDALPGTATFANVASYTASPYVTRATGSAALRFTDVGSLTVNASVAGPATPAAIAGALPAAGLQSSGTVFSVYYFPKARAGSVSTPGAVWFVDRNPCDGPCTSN
jgi:hypothetical protein